MWLILHTSVLSWCIGPALSLDSLGKCLKTFVIWLVREETPSESTANFVRGFSGGGIPLSLFFVLLCFVFCLTKKQYGVCSFY
ncbi:MAG: hypothetical protein CL920_37265 [Deltaproteobacteria bacterium]|nr:hypothetical protein [Deltaproteobacteria bacterium]MBU54382.1 hypothetical protein [Deltaproteobacteria bacterium]